MSNKPCFGRNVGEFLRSAGLSNTVGEDRATEFGVHLKAIAPFGSEKVTLRFFVSNSAGSEEIEFVLMREHSETLELKIGEIGEEMLPELEYFAEVARAYSSACSSFAYTNSSISMLMKKLIQKGFSKDVCEDALACVKKRGFVDEEAIAVRRTQILAEKHWGRSRIVMKLREEGFGAEAMSAASSELDNVDFEASCAALVRKKYGRVPDDSHERELMYASLMRMGYSSSEIKKALKLLN